MGEIEAAVTDTHPLLYHARGGRSLGKRARAAFLACEERRTLIYVPVAVAWEITLLVRAARVELGRSVRSFCDDIFSNPAFQPLDITLEQAMIADEVPILRDPFDALICAAALSLGLPLLTRDRAIEESGVVRTLWE